VDKNGEQNGQMSAFIFHPDKRFYYRYFSIGGTPQCEGYGFWKIEFFVENIAKTKRNSTYTLL
jgi:hypothetical protein